MNRSGQRFHAGDSDGIRSGAFNLRTHLVQLVGQIDDFRLFCRILNNRHILRQGCRHQDVFRRSYAWKVQVNGIAHQAVRSCGKNYMFFILIEFHRCAQRTESL